MSVNTGSQSRGAAAQIQDLEQSIGLGLGLQEGHDEVSDSLEAEEPLKVFEGRRPAAALSVEAVPGRFLIHVFNQFSWTETEGWDYLIRVYNKLALAVKHRNN